MSKNVEIPIKEYECLRGHLTKALEIFQSLGVQFGSEIAPNVAPKRETKSQKIDKYKNLIGSGKRVKKPNHLKK